VTIINAATNAVIKTVKVGMWPNALAYDSVRNKVYCASQNDGTVTVISGSDDSVLRTVTVGIWPAALAYNPAWNRIYVANEYSSTVSVLRDQGGGIEEASSTELRAPNTGPTIVRGILSLPPSLLSPPSSLLSIDGRKVLGLRPGPNDVRRLAPGVYFVTEHGARRTVRARKVILQ
jgi:YVTN family beta-propeller protein